jgi:hypothetical protein
VCLRLAEQDGGGQVPSYNNWLDPVIVVVCLLVSQLVFSQRLTLSVAYLALFAFIVSALLLYRSDRNRHRPGQTALSRLLSECSRVFVRWGAIVAVLLFFAFAFATDLGLPCCRRRTDGNRGVQEPRRSCESPPADAHQRHGLRRANVLRTRQARVPTKPSLSPGMR